LANTISAFGVEQSWRRQIFAKFVPPLHTNSRYVEEKNLIVGFAAAITLDDANVAFCQRRFAKMRLVWSLGPSRSHYIAKVQRSWANNFPDLVTALENIVSHISDSANMGFVPGRRSSPPYARELQIAGSVVARL